jgi:CubicO group peptidase (beta-lactamase class C family)
MIIVAEASMCKLSARAIGLLTFLFSCTATLQSADFDFSRVEQVLSAEISRQRIPGVMIAIVQGDQILMQKGFGAANLETAQPVKAETLFPIASATKMFTAIGLVTLAEQGKVDLNAPIEKYISGLNPAISKLTTHQLLSHTAGLTEGEVATERISPELALPDAVRKLGTASIFEQAGRVFSYSNLGYALAGALIESVAGQPYSTFIANTVLKPMNMATTTYDLNTAITYPFSQGYRISGPTGSELVRPFPRVARWGQPGFGLFSNTADLANFARAFTRGGRPGTRPTALSEYVIKKVASAAVPFPYEGDYGYGLRLYEHRGLNVVEHGGQIIGFGSLIYMVPEREFAVIILANMTAAGRLYSVVDAALEAVLGVTAPSPGSPVMGEHSRVGAEDGMKYAGTYTNTNEIQLFVRDDGLFYKENGRELPVSKLPSGYFLAQAPLAPVYFLLKPAPDGKVMYLYKGMAAYRRKSRD